MWNLSSTGRQFKKDCDYVHSMAEDIINKRRLVLVRNDCNQYLYPDLMWNLSPTGRQFRKVCYYAHAMAEDIINKRRLVLVRNYGVKKYMSSDTLVKVQNYQNLKL